MNVPLIYRKRPVFGFDLGSRTAKMVQLRADGRGTRVVGYGYATFPPEALVEGIIVDPEPIAEALRPLLSKMTYGKITAGRVAVSLPTAKVFTRMLTLPPMGAADLAQAVRYEVEQYVPVPISDLYVDYETLEQTKENLNVLMVAAPRAIVDSYIKLFDLLGLEVGFVEPSLQAVSRAITATRSADTPTLVADFGSESIDVTVFDKNIIRLSDTINVGGDHLTDTLMKDFGISREQANNIKYKFGIGPSDLQPKVVAALGEQLKEVTNQIRRVAKYYQDHSEDKETIKSIIIAGGSASMPGLIEYLSAQLSISVVVADPWADIKVKGIPSVNKHEAPMYTTALGLARLEMIK